LRTPLTPRAIALKRKWLSDEELPGTADEIGRCGDENGHGFGNQVREVHRLAREHKILAETSSAENVGVPVEPATPVIIPVDLRKVAIGLPDEKLSKLAKLPAGDAGGPLK